MKQSQKSVIILTILGTSQLIIGLALSLLTALTYSWLFGLVLAGGFFSAANILFYQAWKKLEH